VDCVAAVATGSIVLLPPQPVTARIEPRDTIAAPSVARSRRRECRCREVTTQLSADLTLRLEPKALSSISVAPRHRPPARPRVRRCHVGWPPHRAQTRAPAGWHWSLDQC